MKTTTTPWLLSVLMLTLSAFFLAGNVAYAGSKHKVTIDDAFPEGTAFDVIFTALGCAKQKMCNTRDFDYVCAKRSAVSPGKTVGYDFPWGTSNRKITVCRISNVSNARTSDFKHTHICFDSTNEVEMKASNSACP